MSEPNPSSESLSPLKRALVELRELRGQLDAADRRQHEPIAIVGAGLRLPGGARDAESFWQLLARGVDAVTEIPADRWDVNAYFDPDPDAPGKMYTRDGAFLDRVDQFDPEFFGISPREAISMDPQHRLLLEVTWEALENAGQSPARLAGQSGGVFLGMGNSDYFRRVYADEQKIDAYSALGNSFSVASGRLSYFLGLHGPCMVVDTACSGSLVAVHLACQSLRAGESSLAVAGGVNLILTPEANINFCKSRMLAPDGRCKTFDAAADGYVRGEGCAVVVLKTLSAAQANGDRILAVIRGSAVNQDGRSGGLTAPNGPAQEAVIRSALAAAGVEPRQLGYLEAHGTGTSLGDPIEVRAAGAVLGPGRPTDQPLMLGSLKTNVGHLEAAAGIAGLLKVVLALQHREIPPHLHLQKKSPFIEWDRWPLVVPTMCVPWQPIDGRRLAGVSSFGFSGTNAHVILEEAPSVAPALAAIDRPMQLLTLSAKTPAALRVLATGFHQRLAATPAAALADVCFTANAGRSHFAHRLAVLGETGEQLQAGLLAYTQGATAPNLAVGEALDGVRPPVAFLFTGQGSQYVGMGRRLYETSPTFRRALERCDEILRPLLPRPLLSVLFPNAGESSPLDETAYTQPALFALEYALAELWQSWGVKPTVVMGHSVGEYVAACVAGVFSLDDGLKLIAERARLMQSLPAGGGMVAVFADAARVGAAIAPHAGRVSIAAINGPESIVVAGANESLDALRAELAAQGVKSKPLVVSHAFHSPLLEPVLPAFERAAAGVRFAEARVGFISNLTGEMADARTIGHAGYWRRHAREPVQFVAAMNTLAAQAVPLLLEIGPNPVLLGMGRRCLPDGPQQWLPSLRSGRDDWRQLFESLQALYVAGADIDWAGVERDYPRQRVALPTYPFQRQRYWFDQQPSPAAVAISPWQAATTVALRQSGFAPLGLNVFSYEAKWRCLDRLTTAHAAQALRDLGAFARAGETRTVAGLQQEFQIPTMYHHLLHRWLERLVGQGWLRQSGEHFLCDRPLPDPELAARKQDAEAELADDPNLLDYVRHCGDKLPAVIVGRESPLETLFPGGSFALAQKLYEGANGSRYINGLAGAAMEAAARSLPPGRTLRVLEVGAGTGGTAATLLPLLDPRRTVYHYTDLSDFFLAHAREKFRAHPFVRFGLFDLEKDLAAQGWAPGSVDVIVGANVVHAVRDLAGALRHLRSLLAPGGFLMLLESTIHHAWFDMTTGLIEGWQHFADDLRGDNPLLPPEKWQSLLTAHGFAEAAAYPSAGSPAGVLGQHLILARAPGSDVLGSTSAATGGAADSTAAAVPGAAAVAGPAIDAAAVRQFRQQLADAVPDERADLMLDYVRQRVMQVLRLEAARPPDRRARLMDLGMDSLMAVQFRNQLEAGLDLHGVVPATLMFDHPTIEAIARFLINRIATAAPVNVAPAAAETAAAPRLRAAEIEELSEAEAEAILLNRLDAKPTDPKK